MEKKIIILILIYAVIIIGGLFACWYYLFKPYSCRPIQNECIDNECLTSKNAQECGLSILFDNLYGEI